MISEIWYFCPRCSLRLWDVYE